MEAFWPQESWLRGYKLFQNSLSLMHARAQARTHTHTPFPLNLATSTPHTVPPQSVTRLIMTLTLSSFHRLFGAGHFAGLENKQITHRGNVGEAATSRWENISEAKQFPSMQGWEILHNNVAKTRGSGTGTKKHGCKCTQETCVVESCQAEATLICRGGGKLLQVQPWLSGRALALHAEGPRQHLQVWLSERHPLLQTLERCCQSVPRQSQTRWTNPEGTRCRPERLRNPRTGE